MKPMGSVLLALLGLLPAATASADYGDPGTVEIGGTFDLARQSVSVDGEDSSLTMVEFLPFVGVFVVEGFQVGGLLDLGYAKDDDGSATVVGFAASLAYYVSAKPIYVGPRLLVGYERTDLTLSSRDIEASGLVVGGGLSVNAPVGEGGLFNFGMIFRYYSFDATLEGPFEDSASGNVLTFGPSAGFSVFF